MSTQKAGSKIVACRFCGQSIIVDGGEEMSPQQLEEYATMKCGCDGAVKYQENGTRRHLAKERIRELFGDGAEEEFQQPQTVRGILADAVDAVCNEEIKSVTLTIRKGLKCKIAWTSAEKIRVTREVSRNSEFVQ